MLLDWRHRLAYFLRPKATITTLAVGVATFVVWDCIGISLGVFFSGNSPYMSGLYLGPEFPVEELFFLYFLCYFTLIMFRLGEKRWQQPTL